MFNFQELERIKIALNNLADDLKCSAILILNDKGGNLDEKTKSELLLSDAGYHICFVGSKDHFPVSLQVVWESKFMDMFGRIFKFIKQFMSPTIAPLQERGSHISIQVRQTILDVVSNPHVTNDAKEIELDAENPPLISSSSPSSTGDREPGLGADDRAIYKRKLSKYLNKAVSNDVIGPLSTKFSLSIQLVHACLQLVQFAEKFDADADPSTLPADTSNYMGGHRGIGRVPFTFKDTRYLNSITVALERLENFVREKWVSVTKLRKIRFELSYLLRSAKVPTSVTGDVTPALPPDLQQNLLR